MVLGVSGSGLKGLMARGVGFKACRVWELAVRESTEILHELSITNKYLQDDQERILESRLREFGFWVCGKLNRLPLAPASAFSKAGQRAELGHPECRCRSRTSASVRPWSSLEPPHTGLIGF